MPKIAYKTCAACGYTYGPNETNVCLRCGEKSLLGTEQITLPTHTLPIFHEIYDSGANVGLSALPQNIALAVT